MNEPIQIGWAIMAKHDNSIFQRAVPLGWSTTDALLKQAKEHPWVKAGTATVIPIYRIPE